MQFGITAPYFTPKDVAEIAQAAEQAGVDGLFIGDAIWTVDPMISLAAAAMVTHRIRLGTLIIPAPLRVPWKIASESLALDHLSGGRLILGLGMGATWMGWQAFPSVPVDTRGRAEMLDETIDILTLMYRREPFDYHGKHFPVNLTQLDVQHYPPQPIQQPRIPIWIPGVWPREKSMRRVLKCDGLLAARMDGTGKFAEVRPEDVRAMKAYLADHRPLDSAPVEIIVEGKSTHLAAAARQELYATWEAAGATWWIESNWEKNKADVLADLMDKTLP